MKNNVKRKTWFVCRLVVLLGLVCAAFFIVHHTQTPSREVADAKPNDGTPIVVDASSDTDRLELPYDNLGLKEDYLINSGPYGSYHQNTGSVSSFTKDYIDGYYDYRGIDGQMNHPGMSIELDNGNFLVLVAKQDTDTEGYTGYFAVHLSKQGEVLYMLDTYTEQHKPGGYYRFDSIIGKSATNPNVIYLTGRHASRNGILTLTVGQDNRLSVALHSEFPDGTLTAGASKITINNRPLLVAMIGTVGYNDGRDNAYWDNLKIETFLFNNGVSNPYIGFEHPKLLSVLKPNAPRERYTYIPNDTIKVGNNLNNFAFSGLYYHNLTGVPSYQSVIHTNDANGRLTDTYVNPDIGVMSSFYHDLCTATDLYWQDISHYDYSIKVKHATVSSNGIIGNVETILEFPANSTFYITKIGDQLSYLAYLGNTVPIFDRYGVPANSFVVGAMDTDFNIESVLYEQLNGSISIRNVIPFYDGDLMKIFYSGDTYSNEVIEDLYPENYTGTPPRTQLKTFWGTSQARTDYAPAIYEGDSIVVNNTEITTANMEEFNNYLIYGNVAGNVTEDSVQVYDRFDVELYNMNGATPEARLQNLYSRINKNFNNLDNEIDWSALGLDINTAGPQLVTYFIADSQLQLSTTSKIVSVVDDKTQYDENFALRAENFALNADVLDLDALSKSDILTNSNVLAWITAGENVGDIITDRVEYDQEQWSTILQAYGDYKEKRGTDEISYEKFDDLLKPYPLTFTCTQNGETLTREVSVYLTNNNTNVDKENNYVFYADNFEEYLRNAAGWVDSDLFRMTISRVYIFDTLKYAENNPITLSSDGLTTNRQDPDGVNNAQIEGVYSLKLAAENGTYVNNNAKARLIGDEVTLKIRQVVEDDREDLVIPTEGYARFAQDDTANPNLGQLTNDAFYIESAMPSGDDPAAVDYKEINFTGSFSRYTYWIHPIIPSYYRVDRIANPDGSLIEINDSMFGKIGKITYQDTSTTHEITIYLKPSVTTEEKVNFYSWNYQENELGTFAE